MKGITLVALALMVACGTPTYLPKPIGYNRIDLPEHLYQSSPDSLPYQFEYSRYAVLQKDKSWMAERYWIDIVYPEIGADIQITYKPIKNKENLMEEFLSDSYKLTNQHNVKAYSIEEQIIELPNGDFASYTELEGEVPTQLQFHVTDSSRHFLRGALYFKTATKNDSLAPVIQFIKQDALHMLTTLKWKDLD